MKRIRDRSDLADRVGPLITGLARAVGEDGTAKGRAAQGTVYTSGLT